MEASLSLPGSEGVIVKREVRQFGFLTVALILGACVLFVVGFEMGRVVNIDNLGGIAASLASSGKSKAAKSDNTQKLTDEFSFFDDLDNPAAPRQRNKLTSPEGNANNEGIKKTRKRKKHRYRKLARMERPRKNTRRVLDREPVASASPTAARRVLGATVAPRAIKRAAAPEIARSGRYVLQAGSFGSSSEAQQVVAQLKSRGLPVRMVTKDAPGGGQVHRVYVGRYSTMDEAKSIQSKVGRRTIIRSM